MKLLSNNVILTHIWFLVWQQCASVGKKNICEPTEVPRCRDRFKQFFLEYLLLLLYIFRGQTRKVRNCIAATLEKMGLRITL